MRHTSGLTYGGRGTTAVHQLYPPNSNGAGATLTTAQFLDRLAANPLLYQPGTVWEYGFSIDVLGLVVEAVTGLELGQFLKQRLFGPLGMVDTGFPGAGEQVGDASPVRFATQTPIPASRAAMPDTAAKALLFGVRRWRRPRLERDGLPCRSSCRCCWTAVRSAIRVCWGARPWRRCGPTT